LIICVYFISVNIIPEQYHHALFYISPLVRILDFIIGIGLFYIWEHMESKEHKKKYLTTIIEAFSICVFIIMLALSKDIPQVYRYASYYWIPISTIILGFALSHKLGGGIISKILSLKPLVIAGEISFGFYMFHSLIIRIAKKIITLPIAFEFLITFTLVLAVSTASFYFFEKPMNKWIRRKFS
jgi:peptidoglycan/LPS O-acetylase OafA/YrhL